MSIFWPEVKTLKQSNDVRVTGTLVATIISSINAVAAFVSIFVPNRYATPWSFIDAALFAVIAIGIWFRSRIAAVVGLGLYLLSQSLFWSKGEARNPVLTIFFALMFIHAIRATFAWHLLVKQKKQLVGVNGQ